MLATAPAPASGVPPCRARPAVHGRRERTAGARSPAKLAPARRPSQPARRPLRGGLRLASARRPASVACSRLAWPSPARRFPARCGSLQRGKVGLAVGPHQATDILGRVSPWRFRSYARSSSSEEDEEMNGEVSTNDTNAAALGELGAVQQGPRPRFGASGHRAGMTVLRSPSSCAHSPLLPFSLVAGMAQPCQHPCPARLPSHAVVCRVAVHALASQPPPVRASPVAQPAMARPSLAARCGIVTIPGNSPAAVQPWPRLPGSCVRSWRLSSRGCASDPQPRPCAGSPEPLFRGRRKLVLQKCPRLYR
jgi:hypothetical protein